MAGQSRWKQYRPLVVFCVDLHHSGGRTLCLQLEHLFGINCRASGRPRQQILNIRESVFRASARLLEIAHHAGVDVAQQVGQIDLFLFDENTKASYLTPNDLIKLKEDVQKIWRNTQIRSCLDRADEFNVYTDESDKFFLDNASRILAPQYVLTREDIIRDSKTAFFGAHLLINDRKIHVLKDKRNCARTLWNLDFFMFCVSLSAYNQADYMKNSLIEFRECCSLDCFQNTSKIIILTKTDVFREKLLRLPFSNFFPDYVGANDYESAVAFIRDMFWKAAVEMNVECDLVIHSVCVVNEADVRSLFEQPDFFADDIVPCHDFDY